MRCRPFCASAITGRSSGQRGPDAATSVDIRRCFVGCSTAGHRERNGVAPLRPMAPGISSGVRRTVGAVSQPSNGRPRRLSLYVLLLLLGVGIGGTIYLATRSRTPKPSVGLAYVYTAARDLPAFHQIAEEDLRKSPVLRSSLPKAPVTSRDALLGHYTLDPVGQDTPIDAARIGPMLPVGALRATVVTGLPASPADVMHGGLSQGDEVDVVLSPRAPSRSSGGATLQHVLVMDVLA